jgi:hypothetical protein
MATNFPASLDSLTNPTSSDSLNSPSHSAQHANVNDAVEALQAKVGADSSAVTTSLDYKVAQLESDVAGLVTGKILQVVQTTKTTSFSTSSTSLVDVTGLSVSITPTSATSKVLVQISVGLVKTDTNYVRLTVFRGNAATGTNLASPVTGFGLIRADAHPYGFGFINYLDSPATTSATTYQAAIAMTAGSGFVQGEKSTITVWEVAA